MSAEELPAGRANSSRLTRALLFEWMLTLDTGILLLDSEAARAHTLFLPSLLDRDFWDTFMEHR